MVLPCATSRVVNLNIYESFYLSNFFPLLNINFSTITTTIALWILTRRPGKKTYSLVSLLNPSPYGMCLERKTSFFGLFKSSKVGIGLCSKSGKLVKMNFILTKLNSFLNPTGSKNWEFEFADTKHIRLSTQGFLCKSNLHFMVIYINYENMLKHVGQCVVRGKKGYKSAITVEPCKKRGGKDGNNRLEHF